MTVENVIVEIYLPTIQKYFDFSIPLNCRLSEAKLLIGAMLETHSEHSYKMTENSMLFDKESGRVLDEELTIQALEIKNGARLFYI